MIEAGTARRAWQVGEPVHGLVYFTPGLRDVTDAAGLRGFWMAYFAMRAAPLGAAGVDLVTATFFGFHRSLVERAVPEAWRRISADEALELRLRWVDVALRRVLGDALEEPALAATADLAWAAAQACDTAGRPLAAANQALPRPAQPHLALWQALTTLREHRGDGHIAVLVARRHTPAHAHLLKAGSGETEVSLLRDGRGYPEPEWRDAQRELVEAGLLTDSGELTAAGAEEHVEIERLTDLAALRPWKGIGEDATAALVAALTPLARRVFDAGVLPQPNPVGLVAP